MDASNEIKMASAADAAAAGAPAAQKKGSPKKTGGAIGTQLV